MPFRTGHEACTVRINPDGTVTAFSGVTSQGQGLETTIAQVVADAVGVCDDAVEVRTGDTDESLWGFGAFSSRQAVIGGGAARLAGQAVRDRALRLAAGLLDAKADELTLFGGQIFVNGDEQPSQPGRGRPGRLPGVEPAAAGHRAGPGGDPLLRPDPRRVRRRGAGRQDRDRPGHGGAAHPGLDLRGGRGPDHPPADRRRADRGRRRPGYRRRPVRAPHLRRGGKPVHRQPARLPDAHLGGDPRAGHRARGPPGREPARRPRRRRGRHLGPAAALAGAVGDALGVAVDRLPITPSGLWELMQRELMTP